MKAFITGGTGFIGSHLVDQLIEDGNFDLRCLIRKSEKWLNGKAFTRVYGDLDNLPVIDKALKNIDLVIHSAALTKARNKKDLESANVRASEHLIRLCIKNNVPKIIVLSSQAASGPSFGRPKVETDEMNPVSNYGESKKKMEEIIHTLNLKNTSITIIRPSSVYGPREEDIYNYFRAASMGFSPVVGEGYQISLTHVKDIIQVIRRSIDYQHEGIETFFATSQQSYNWLEIKEATENALGRKLKLIRLSPALVTNMSAVIENVASYIGKYPVINQEKAREMIHEWQCSSEKAERILGYRQTVSLYDGIRDTIEWYKAHEWL